MTENAIDEFRADMSVKPGAQLNAKRVTHHTAQDSDAAAPLVVFRIDNGCCLGAGYYRLDAARRRGPTSIRADIRAGSRSSALRYAGSGSVRPT